AYLSLYKNFDNYVEFEENHIKNLVCKIALNKCKDLLKSARYQKVVSTDIEETFSTTCDDEDLEESLFANERKKHSICVSLCAFTRRNETNQSRTSCRKFPVGGL
ncbi:MAG: hypothetical protein RR813_07865, partial [Enterococcus sp.]